MTWAAAWAWVQSYNAAVEAAHGQCRTGERLDALQVDWVEGHFVLDSAVPASCFNFGPAGNGAPIGHILPAVRWRWFGQVPGAPRGCEGWQKLPICGPADVRWAGWRKSRHWQQGGTEPLPHERERKT
jgi:hypothetical protein